MHVAALTSATTISTQSSSTAEKGCSVLSIACDMPGSLVIYYNNYFERIVFILIIIIIFLFFLLAAGIVLGIRTRLETQY